MVVEDEYLIGTAKELRDYIEPYAEDNEGLGEVMAEIMRYKDDVMLLIDDMNGMGYRVIEYEGED